MSVASAWLGDIGEYPPHPSRLSNTPLVRRLRLRTSGGIANLEGFGGYSPLLFSKLEAYSVLQDMYLRIHVARST